jgi:hypothetical protein
MATSVRFIFFICFTKIGNGRYLDDNRINGTLDLTQLIANGLVRTTSVNESYGLTTLSMMNSDITDVTYPEGSIEGITTIIR